MIKCLIVDDEPLAVNLLKDYVDKTPELECISATTNVLEALRCVQDGRVDLVFLDIQMPELTGIQFMKIIRNNCSVIITSAYAQYAIEGYEHDVVDYLLKPVTFDRFMIAVTKARNKLAAQPATGSTSDQQDHIFIKTSNRLQRFNLADIFYIEGLRDYIAVHSTHGKTLSLESLKNMQTLLPADKFARIHKSYIVNKSKISFLEKGSVIINRQTIPIGETYREEFMAGINKTK